MKKLSIYYGCHIALNVANVKLQAKYEKTNEPPPIQKAVLTIIRA